ncbi:MAG TPA: cupin domain-containing protein [Alphaproteobacteria bacterium]|nr:cupin domain-containing protein [Alphaproteobacteria bacterium]
MASVRIDQYLFGDDGKFPNNRDLPLLVYRGVLDRQAKDPAGDCERLFARHRWTGAWRNGIYDYDHFHATAHEVLGIVRGEVRVRFGGEGGRVVEVHAGDVVVIPAGVGHRNMGASPDLVVVGAYPDGDGEPEICTGKGREHEHALKTVPQVPMPAQDPVFGEAGPLRERWRL